MDENPILSKLFGFPLEENHRFYFDGRYCRVGSDGVVALKFLAEVYRLSSENKGINWALRLRTQLRQLRFLTARTVLSFAVERTPDPRIRLLAIWLRGRCGGYIGTSTIARFATSSDFRTRKEVARALNRMSGWPFLAKIARNDPNPRVRKLATQTPRKPHRLRLERFSRNVRRTQMSYEQRSVWIAPNIHIGEGKTPKSTLFIRQVLERIHRIISMSVYRR